MRVSKGLKMLRCSKKKRKEKKKEGRSMQESMERSHEAGRKKD